MGGTIDYYFAPISGYAYLGHHTLMDIARAHGAQVNFRPLMIARVFAASETTPPFAQSPPRRCYRIEDQARWAALKGLKINKVPAHWPTDPGPACKTIIAAGKLGFDQDAITAGCLKAVWAQERNIAEPAVLQGILTDAGADPAAVTARAKDADIEAEVAKITEDAISAGVFGSPTYVFDGQRYWGQDRLDFLATALGQ